MRARRYHRAPQIATEPKLVPLPNLLNDIEIDNVNYEGFAVLPAHLDRNGYMNIGYFSMCINMTTRRSAPWPDEPAARLRVVYEAHRLRPRPAEVERTLRSCRSTGRLIDWPVTKNALQLDYREDLC